MKRRLMREAVENGDMKHIPVSSNASFGELRLNVGKCLLAFVETEETHQKETRPFKDRL